MAQPGQPGEQVNQEAEGDQPDSLRRWVDHSLSLIDDVRSGHMNYVQITLTHPDGIGVIEVTAEDADQSEAIIRNSFSQRFPDLISDIT